MEFLMERYDRTALHMYSKTTMNLPGQPGETEEATHTHTNTHTHTHTHTRALMELKTNVLTRKYIRYALRRTHTVIYQELLFESAFMCIHTVYVCLCLRVCVYLYEPVSTSVQSVMIKLSAI